MAEQKDIISKLHERIGNPMLASLFMYLIYLADENGVVHKSYTEIGDALYISRQLVYKYICRLQSVYKVLTDGIPITVLNIGFYKGFTHTSFTLRLQGVNAGIPKKKTEKVEGMYSDDPQMNEVIKTWLAYKKERRQTYKPIGLKTLVGKLLKMSGGNADVARQIVEQSIMNNYSGLFPLKDSDQNMPPDMILQNSKNIDYEKGMDRFNRE